MEESIHVAVVGGGQAGLAAGYYLKRAGIDFAIFDRHGRVGESWRRRWSSLRLFTPARIDSLPGQPFPAPPDEHPSKDRMAAYLEDYALRHELPVRLGVGVERVERTDGQFRLQLAQGSVSAGQVIIATGANQTPRLPGFACELAPEIKQLTAASYSSPADLAAGAVLVVGAGNSGSEIALEAAAAGRRVLLSGRDTGKGDPRFFRPLPWWVGTHLLTTSTPFGRRMAARMSGGGAPRFFIERADLSAAGVELVPRTAGVEHGMPILEDGRRLEVGTVVWCAGFRQDFSWIVPSVVDHEGRPPHRRGASTVQPGLYFLGLPFQRSVASTLVGGAAIDARKVVKRVVRRIRRVR